MNDFPFTHFYKFSIIIAGEVECFEICYILKVNIGTIHLLSFLVKYNDMCSSNMPIIDVSSYLKQNIACLINGRQS